MTAAEFLRLSLSRKFKWGEMDCALWAADFPRLDIGVDPAAHLRGTYDTKLGCYRTIIAGGGLRSVARKCMASDRFGPLEREGIGVAKVDKSLVCGVIRENSFYALTDKDTIRVMQRPADLEGWSWSRL